MYNVTISRFNCSLGNEFKKIKLLLIFLSLSFLFFADDYPLFVKEDIKIENKEKIIEWVYTNNIKEFLYFYFRDIDDLYNLKNKSLLKYQRQKDNLLYLIELHTNLFYELFGPLDHLYDERLNFIHSNKNGENLILFLLWFYHLNNTDTVTNDELKNYRKVCKQLQEGEIVSNFIMGLAITLPNMAKKVEYSPKLDILKVKKYTYQLGVYVSYFNNSSNYFNFNVVNEFMLFDGVRTYQLDYKAMARLNTAIKGDLLPPNSRTEGEIIFYHYNVMHYKYNYVMIYRPLLIDDYYQYQIFDIDGVKRFADFKLNF